MASHVHSVFGSVNFGNTVSLTDLSNGNTTCRIPPDRSMYWAPSMYYKTSNGTFNLVPSGFKAYYFNRGKTTNFKPIPKNLRILMGSASNRVKPAQINDTTPHYVCFSYVAGGASGNGSYSTFPPLICGVWQARIMFPDCWDGVNLDSTDHKSHMAYRNSSDYCPPTHPVRIPQVFFEVDYNVGGVNAPKDAFVLATGDKSGLSMHADFISGWDKTLLMSAITTCFNNDQNDPGCALNKYRAVRTNNAKPIKPMPTEQITGLKGLLLGPAMAAISDVPYTLV